MTRKRILVFFSKPSDNDEKQKYFKTKSCILRGGVECYDTSPLLEDKGRISD
jgi:hypothetical protein